MPDASAEPVVEELPELPYDVLFSAQIGPTEKMARASIRLGAGSKVARSIQLAIDPERHVDFVGDGDVTVEEDRVFWVPPPGGGRLRYSFRIEHLKTSSSYDARCADNWALFRGGDLFPPARVRTLRGAVSRSRLRLRVPEGWSVAVPYGPHPSGGHAIEDPDRRFDRPTGWMVMGQLGVVRERIAGTRVAVAGPVEQGLRRQDILALLRWNLPVLRDIVGTLPERLLVVGAGDPMWRGGLSGPNSVFLHADRPLISSDMTSPLLHEVVHAVMGARAGPGGDWIVEGMAELYSLEMLARSKTVSRKRYRHALQRLEKRGASAGRLDVDAATGDATARSAIVLHEIGNRIHETTDGAADLDDVTAILVERHEPLTTELLLDAIREVAGQDLGFFVRARLGAARAQTPPVSQMPPADIEFE